MKKKVFLPIAFIVVIAFWGCQTPLPQEPVKLKLPDTLKLDEKYLKYFSSVQIIDTFKFIKYINEEEYRIVQFYSKILDSVNVCEYSKIPFEANEEFILKSDFIVINNQKIEFDSLIYQYLKVGWYRKTYSQNIEFRSGYIFQYDSKKIITLEIFNENSSDDVDKLIYFFELKNKNADFIGLEFKTLLTPNCISDFNSDGNLDVLAWNVNEDTIKMYSIIEKKLQYSNEFLKIEYPKEKNYEPCIIVSQSNFSLLTEFIKKINKDFE